VLDDECCSLSGERVSPLPVLVPALNLTGGFGPVSLGPLRAKVEENVASRGFQSDLAGSWGESGVANEEVGGDGKVDEKGLEEAVPGADGVDAEEGVESFFDEWGGPDDRVAILALLQAVNLAEGGKPAEGAGARVESRQRRQEGRVCILPVVWRVTARPVLEQVRACEDGLQKGGAAASWISSG
jgi:hypothetical protein